MVPYDTYRIYQIERAKSPAEVRRAGQQGAQLAFALSSLFMASPAPCKPCAGQPPPQRAACPARPDQPGLCCQPEPIRTLGATLFHA